MGNETTPIKGAFCALVAAKLVAMLGMDPASAGTVAISAWMLLTAALAYVVPHDLEAKVAGIFGVTL